MSSAGDTREHAFKKLAQQDTELGGQSWRWSPTGLTVLLHKPRWMPTLGFAKEAPKEKMCLMPISCSRP